MPKKEPETMRGIERKLLTGNGRKKSPAEKLWYENKEKWLEELRSEKWIKNY